LFRSDLWMQLHAVYECIWDYRFLFRDLVDILTRNRKLRLHFSRILKRASDNATGVMRAMVRAGVMRASADEIRATADNILVIATFWLNFSAVRGERDEQEAIRLGIHQVFMLLAPFLRDAERLHLNQLVEAYLPDRR
ncbi:MAG: TetR/AcrR family transcriptional regulator, partial [Lysobacteraceae bacterium]